MVGHQRTRRGHIHQIAVVLATGATIAAALAAAPTPAGAVPTAFDVEQIATVVSHTDLDWTPDGRMLVTAKTGAVRVIDDDELLPTPAIDLSAALCTDAERGVSGIAVHPDFDQNGYVYLYYTYPKNGNCGQSEIDGPVNRASRFVMTGNTIDPATELVLFDTPPLYKSNHNSGDFAFGPDGFLYVTVGDSAAPRPWNRPQDPGYLLGKIVRITDDGDIPAGNPFTGPDSARCAAEGVPPAGSPPDTRCQEVFATGLRNPWRMAMDPNSAETRFYINDVGHTLWEEINEGVEGADYGWPLREGPCAFGSVTDCAVPVGVVDPLHWFLHTELGGAVIGGAFVPNGLWPSEYDGAYLFADYTNDTVYRLAPGGPDCRTCLPPTSAYLSEVFADIDDVAALTFGPHAGSEALYLLSGGGGITRVTYVGDANRTPSAVATADTTSGPLPLSVQFDGSASSDPDAGDTLTYDWDFGDGSPHSSAVAPLHTYDGAGTFQAVLTVDDGNGARATATVRVDPGNNAPVPTIDTPTDGSVFAVGEVLTLHASGTDLEDGTLPDSAFTWEVLQHHNAHIHPYLDPTVGNDISIVAPAPEDLLAAENSYLEVVLTATDAGGVQTTVRRDVQPHRVNITFETDPPGLDLVLEGQTRTTPQTVVSWNGHVLPVRASDQLVGPTLHYWSDWSDGGVQAHDIPITGTGAGYTATFSTTEPVPRVVPGSTSVDEGDTGTTTVSIPVLLSRPSSQTVTVDWTTVEVPGDAFSTEGNYVAASGTATFLPGETMVELDVEVVGDVLDEVDEYVVVSTSNPTNASLGGFWGLGFAAIVDDDPPPRVVPGGAAIAEGSSGTTTIISIPVSLSAPSAKTVVVDWATVDLAGNPDLALSTDDDFVAASGTTTFEPGTTDATIDISVIGDDDAESDEWLVVVTSNHVNAVPGGFYGIGLGLLQNDD